MVRTSAGTAVTQGELVQTSRNEEIKESAQRLAELFPWEKEEKIHFCGDMTQKGFWWANWQTYPPLRQSGQ